MTNNHAITTERLRLNPILEEDIEFLIKLEQRNESYKFNSTNKPSREEIINKCKRYIERANLLPIDGAIKWIVSHESIKIGEVHITCNWRETMEWELGYAFMPEYCGYGFASESVKQVVNYSFKHFEVNRIAAFINAENTKSVALAERIGMICDGRMREVRLINGVYYDECVYSILKKDLKDF